MNIAKGFDSIKDEQINYFKGFCFDYPVVMSIETAEKMRKLGKVIYKAISHMNQNHSSYFDLMPRNEIERKILESGNKYKYKVGTFRTDFVIDLNSNIKIIEINAGQPLNSCFTSGFFREIALSQAKTLGIKDIRDLYIPFFAYLENYIAKADHITVVYGKEKPSEIKIYPQIFEKSGIKCHLIPIEKLHLNLNLLENAWVIIELLFEEILALPVEIIESLMKTAPHNAINTYMNAGDKRFFYVLNQSEFVDKVLDEEEKELLKNHLVPTYVYGKEKEVWEKALKNKDDYIIKHYGKGRSEDVYAGSLTDENDWRKLFDSKGISEMVLQPFIEQRKFRGTIGQEDRNDYFTGTLLYFNEEFFGPGHYRTSSLPVSNLADYRKAGQLVADAEEKMSGVYYV